MSNSDVTGTMAPTNPCCSALNAFLPQRPRLLQKPYGLVYPKGAPYTEARVYDSTREQKLSPDTVGVNQHAGNYLSCPTGTMSKVGMLGPLPKQNADNQSCDFGSNVPDSVKFQKLHWSMYGTNYRPRGFGM